MRTFHRLSRETPRTGCRTMDIFHVACALQIPACRFLTFDRRQSLLAGWAGLDVIVPPQLEGAQGARPFHPSVQPKNVCPSGIDSPPGSSP